MEGDILESAESCFDDITTIKTRAEKLTYQTSSAPQAILMKQFCISWLGITSWQLYN